MWKVGVGRVGRSVGKMFAVQGTHLSFTLRPHGEKLCNVLYSCNQIRNEAETRESWGSLGSQHS